MPGRIVLIDAEILAELETHSGDPDRNEAALAELKLCTSDDERVNVLSRLLLPPMTPDRQPLVDPLDPPQQGILDAAFTWIQNTAVWIGASRLVGVPVGPAGGLGPSDDRSPDRGRWNHPWRHRP